MDPAIDASRRHHMATKAPHDSTHNHVGSEAVMIRFAERDEGHECRIFDCFLTN